MRTLKPYARNLYGLAGAKNKHTRQMIMLELTGDKLPLAKCGINALLDRLYSISGVTGSCMAEREKNLSNWIESQC